MWDSGRRVNISCFKCGVVSWTSDEWKSGNIVLEKGWRRLNGSPETDSVLQERREPPPVAEATQLNSGTPDTATRHPPPPRLAHDSKSYVNIRVCICIYFSILYFLLTHILLSGMLTPVSQWVSQSLIVSDWRYLSHLRALWAVSFFWIFLYFLFSFHSSTSLAQNGSFYVSFERFGPARLADSELNHKHC